VVRVSVPFRNQALVIAVAVGSVPEDTPRLVDAVLNLQLRSGSITTTRWKRKGYLQTFFIHADGTVGKGKTHTIVSDDVGGLVTQHSGSDRHVR
jgi:hypothetical protein